MIKYGIDKFLESGIKTVVFDTKEEAVAAAEAGAKSLGENDVISVFYADCYEYGGTVSVSPQRHYLESYRKS